MAQNNVQAKGSFSEDLTNAVETLRKGGVILYPTDTVWGIGCDATNSEAVKKIFEIKKRDDSKALITLVPNDAWIERYIEDVPEVAWELLDVSVKPLTIVYDKSRGLASNLAAPDGSIGIRVCKDPFCKALCERLHKPIVSTSANISGEPAAKIFDEVSKHIIESCDYVVNWRRGDKEIHEPSTIIRLSKGGVFKIIRP